MSRYLVDKFIYRVDRNEEMLKAYMADPAGFVARWEKDEAGKLNESETTSGHNFTDEERKALAERDFEKLYAMGAHGFLLWTMMLPVLEPEFPNFRALVDFYNSKIKPYGRPDFST
ncbi:MAG: hypothetical protein HYV04_17360 [Deltaproteobacteria bacterium]|nr:hypothetical protein [Deltaproteobacteria bacterium]